MKIITSSLLAIALVLALPFAVHAGESPSDASTESATVPVERATIGGTLETKGVLVPAKYKHAKIEFDAYRGKLEIVESVPEGRVVKGQTLVRFEDKDYKKQLAAAERGLEVKRLGLEKAERLHELGKASLAIKRDEVVRAKRLSDEALERFVAVERKLREEDYAYSFKGRRISIENMREELAQLEKMYTEDDLTEETEEIVLKRNRRNMERMLDSFERYRKRHDYNAKRSVDREFNRLGIAARKAAASLDKLQATTPLDQKTAELNLVSARESVTSAEEGLAKLKADGEKFSVKAPIGGYAVRGTFSGGAWKGLGNDEGYKAGKTMKAGQVPYTIVDESVMRVHTSIKESDLTALEVGGKAKVTTVLTGEDELDATVGSVARYGSGGNYKVVLRVKGEDSRLRAGLGCKAVLDRADVEPVLCVPKAAVRKDKSGTFVFDAAGKAIAVKTGTSDKERVEITEGVEEGQQVLAKAPEPVTEKPEEVKEEAAGK